MFVLAKGKIAVQCKDEYLSPGEDKNNRVLGELRGGI
jgi:hypothetical protein